MFASDLDSGQTSRCRCGVAHVLRFLDGKVRQDHVDGIVSEVVVGSGLEVTVQELQGWVRDREQRHSCDNHLFHELESCVCVTRMKMCEVCTECVCTRDVRATGEWVYTSVEENSITSQGCWIRCQPSSCAKYVPDQTDIAKNWRGSLSFNSVSTVSTSC